MAVRLAFDPRVHGFHFSNSFRSHYAGGVPRVTTDGLCGGMALGAFNYFRYGLPIPPHTNADIDFDVSFDILRTRPGTTDLVDYIFHSQVATFENVSIVAFAWPGDPSFPDEFGKVRARIDRGEYLILGLKMRHGVGGLGHQVLCYGYDADTRAAIVYDPNLPDCEVRITAGRAGNDNVVELRADQGATDMRFRAMFEQQELFANRISDRVTYDFPDKVARNLRRSSASPKPPGRLAVVPKVSGALVLRQRGSGQLPGRRGSCRRGQRAVSGADQLSALFRPVPVAVVPQVRGALLRGADGSWRLPERGRARGYRQRRIHHGPRLAWQHPVRPRQLAVVSQVPGHALRRGRNMPIRRCP